LRERLGRFSEHRDSDFSSDSRQGFENGDVAMLAAFLRITRAVSELLQELFELAATRQALRVDDLQTRQDQPNLRLRGFDDTRRASCFGFTAKTRMPRARHASMSAPRGVSIATAICDGVTLVYAMIQSRQACTASAVCTTRRSSRRCPVVSTTQTA
jgi:hypothetical protein